MSYDIIYCRLHPQATLSHRAIDLILPPEIDRTDNSYDTRLVNKKVFCLTYYEDAVNNILTMTQLLTIFTDDEDIAERHKQYAVIVPENQLLSTLWKIFHRTAIPNVLRAIENNDPGTITYLSRLETLPPLFLCDEVIAKVKDIGDAWCERDRQFLEEMNSFVSLILEEYEGKICVGLYVSTSTYHDKLAAYLSKRYSYADHIVIWEYHPLSQITTYNIYIENERLTVSHNGFFSFLGKRLTDKYFLLDALNNGEENPFASDFWQAFIRRKF